MSDQDKTPTELTDEAMDSAAGGKAVPAEQVTLNYTEVEWTYAKAEGKMRPEQKRMERVFEDE
ncbi:MAG: hypothetical protein AAFR17_10275 [Pseudomonadota bacterium]